MLSHAPLSKLINEIRYRYQDKFDDKINMLRDEADELEGIKDDIETHLDDLECTINEAGEYDLD